MDLRVPQDRKELLDLPYREYKVFKENRVQQDLRALLALGLKGHLEPMDLRVPQDRKVPLVQGLRESRDSREYRDYLFRDYRVYRELLDL
jgi:hypothetical protein